MTPEETEVAVVGASTAGLVTALGLARRGVDVTVVDTTPPLPISWSATHHWSVLPVLERLGVLDDALLAGEATAQWGLRVLATGEQHVYDVRELASAVRHAFHLRLEPAALRGILRTALLAHPHARVVDEVRVGALRADPAGATLDLDGAVGGLRARWVVGADGPASAIRRAAGLAFEGTTWTERCVIALVDHDFEAAGYPDTTLQVDGRWGAVLERVGHRRWRYLFQESLAHGEHDIGPRVERVLHEVTGSEPRVLDVGTGRMHQRSASSYRSGRVVLVGEAAHTTHPLTGHTSLSGWSDAVSLVPVLATALRGGAEDAVTRWGDRRRRWFLDDAVPTSLGRRNLVAQISDRRRLAVELDGFRRASADPLARRALLLAEGDVLAAALADRAPF